MKPLDWSYELHVFGTRPKTLSLLDFSELAKRFADLLGSQNSVHFGALRAGSARLMVRVDDDAKLDVQVHLIDARTKSTSMPKVARIDDYLRSKGWHGEVRNHDGATVITFPGALNAVQPQEERVVHQMDSVVGRVIKIGGRDETVPMTLETADGSFVDVNIRGREMAKQLASHLFGAEIRVSGLATWKRDGDGEWSCCGILVDDFVVLNGTSVTDLFEQLKDLPDNGWNKLDDPIGEWKKSRGND